jgi:predicted PolB exonuclease-like 3'-5' exonuclease
MEHVCFFDIETIPTQSPDLRARFRAEVQPPGNIKKAESIEAWMAEHADRAADEAISKTSFDPAMGRICTIAWAIDDGETVVSHATTVDEERDVLEHFFADLNFNANHRYTFVGHYITGFDLRFILCRAVVLGIPIPRCIPRDPKPWDGTVFDTMTAWAGSRGTISMDKLCEALGIPGKGDFTGADVAEAWANGEHSKIAEYCVDDVIRTRVIWQQFQQAAW